MGRGEDPRRLLEAVLPKGSFVPPDIDRITLWKVCIITIWSCCGAWQYQLIVSLLLGSLQFAIWAWKAPETWKCQHLGGCGEISTKHLTNKGKAIIVSCKICFPLSRPVYMMVWLKVPPYPKVGLIQSCSRILVLTGAGVSVSCGIPDFRSKDGVYAR